MVSVYAKCLVMAVVGPRLIAGLQEPCCGATEGGAAHPLPQGGCRPPHLWTGYLARRALF